MKKIPLIALFLCLSLSKVWASSYTDLPTPLMPDSTFRVEDYGAKGDGVTDDTKAIQNAIDAAAVKGGGTVLFQKARYFTRGYLVLRNQVHLKGAVVGPFNPNIDPSQFTSAPTLLITNSHYPFINVGPNNLIVPDPNLDPSIQEGLNVTVEDLLFYYPNQAGPFASAPKIYPPTIQANNTAYGFKIRRVTIANAYDALRLIGCHPAVFEHLLIGALHSGIVLDQLEDFTTLDDIQLKPLWDQINGIPEGSSPIDKWVLANQTVGLVVKRADEIQLEDISIFNFNTGILFTDSTDTDNATLPYLPCTGDFTQPGCTNTTSSGIGYGISVEQVQVALEDKSSYPGTGWSIINFNATAGLSGVLNTGKTIISLPSGGNGVPFLSITGGSIKGNWQGPLTNVQAGLLKITKVNGYNATKNQQAPKIPRSGVALTNPYPVLVNVSISDVRATAIDGTPTKLSNGTFRLAPGETVTLTYDSNYHPSWEWEQVKFPLYITPQTTSATYSAVPKDFFYANAYNFFYVNAYGAKGDGKTDDTAAIQAAINAAASSGGTREVVFGMASYFTKGTLTLPANVTLAGDYEGPPNIMTQPLTQVIVAPTLLVTNTQAPFITVTGPNAAITDLLFYYPNQVSPNGNQPNIVQSNTKISLKPAPKANLKSNAVQNIVQPNVYPVTVSIPKEATGFTAERDMFLNSYDAIKVLADNVFFHELDIGAFHVGIQVDGGSDSLKIDHIFNQVFWDDPSNSYPSLVDNWVAQHGIALEVGSATKVSLNEFLLYWRYIGILLDDTANPINGYPTNSFGTGTQVDFDGYIGIVAKSTAAQGWSFENLVIGNASPGNSLIPAIELQQGGKNKPLISMEGGFNWGSWLPTDNFNLEPVDAGVLKMNNVNDAGYFIGQNNYDIPGGFYAVGPVSYSSLSQRGIDPNDPPLTIKSNQYPPAVMTNDPPMTSSGATFNNPFPYNVRVFVGGINKAYVNGIQVSADGEVDLSAGDSITLKYDTDQDPHWTWFAV